MHVPWLHRRRRPTPSPPPTPHTIHKTTGEKKEEKAKGKGEGEEDEEEAEDGPAWAPRDPSSYTGALTFDDLRARVRVRGDWGWNDRLDGVGPDGIISSHLMSPPTFIHIYVCTHTHTHQARAYNGGYERFSWVTGERVAPLPGKQ